MNLKLLRFKYKGIVKFINYNNKGEMKMEELMVKKSIFRQKQLKELYSKDNYNSGKPSLNPYVDREQTGDDYTYECNLEMPLLKEGELFYIEEDDKTLSVRQVIRTSKDNILYICEPNIIGDREAYNKIKEELRQEFKEWESKLQKEESKLGIKGIRKLIKNLFKL